MADAHVVHKISTPDVDIVAEGADSTPDDAVEGRSPITRAGHLTAVQLKTAFTGFEESGSVKGIDSGSSW